LAFCILAAFAVSGQDPYAVVFSWMSALAVIGIVTVQILVSLSVIAFFRREDRALGVWPRLIAPALSAVGLSICLGLVIENLPLLSGSHSLVVAAFPYVIAAAGAAGAVGALWLRRRRPAIYESLGRAFEA
jgi:amino acid transporter